MEGSNALKGLLEGVTHLKQATVRMAGDRVIYFDPFMIEGEPNDASLVFVTHTHRDHYSPPDLKRVLKAGATLVITADGVEDAKSRGFDKIVGVLPGRDYTVEGVSFSTVPSYNINKDFHKKSSNWVGYILNKNGARYYIAGDTDLIPEMRDFHADVAFLPVGGTYTMTAGEAADAANIIKPAAAVPIHYGDVVGTAEDAKSFIELLDKGIKGMILKK